MGLRGGYPFRMIRSSRGLPICRPCLDFDQKGRKTYVSTSPVLDPLAAESFRPCGSAK
jgi:hypothetical protein